MRRISIAALAVAAVAAVPSPAAAVAVAPPGTCDLIKNTICHLIPPDEIGDACELQEAIGIRNVMACEGPPEA